MPTIVFLTSICDGFTPLYFFFFHGLFSSNYTHRCRIVSNHICGIFSIENGKMNTENKRESQLRKKSFNIIVSTTLYSWRSFIRLFKIIQFQLIVPFNSENNSFDRNTYKSIYYSKMLFVSILCVYNFNYHVICKSKKKNSRNTTALLLILPAKINFQNEWDETCRNDSTANIKPQTISKIFIFTIEYLDG